MRPVLLVSPEERRRDWLDVALRVMAAFALAFVVGLLGVMLLISASLLGGLNAATSSFSGAASALESAGASLQKPLEGIIGQIQPDRPPAPEVSRGPEFAQLQRVQVGGEVGRTGSYVVTLARISKRDGATDPNQAQYAVLHRKLLTPRQNTVGPVVVGESWDEADYYVYKGEAFRLGASFYQVNWVSVEDNATGVALYRHGDTLIGPLKFQLD